MAPGAYVITIWNLFALKSLCLSLFGKSVHVIRLIFLLQKSVRVVFVLFILYLNVFYTAQVHHTMDLLGVQAVCQNLVNLYWRRGVVGGQLDEEVWLGVR